MHCTSVHFEREERERERERWCKSSSVMSYIIHLHHINFLSVRYPKERKKERQSLEEILIGHAARPIAHQFLSEVFLVLDVLYNNLLQNKCSSSK